MSIIFFVLVDLLIAAIVVNYFFPHWFVKLLQVSARRKAGLQCKQVSAAGFKHWRYLESVATNTPTHAPTNTPTLVFIHGFSSNKDGWVNYPSLFKDYRVIIPDVPGFGDHQRHMGLDTNTNLQVERLHEFFMALGVERFHLTGSSMGGLIAIRYALRFPEQVKTLTLMNSAGVKLLSDEEMTARIAKDRIPFLLDSVDDADRFINTVFHKKVKLPAFMKRAMYKEANRDRDILTKQYKTLIMEVLENSINDDLKNLLMPTLIIWGRHDQVVDVASTDVMAREIKDHQLEIIETIGHLPMMEAPKPTADIQRAFIHSKQV